MATLFEDYYRRAAFCRAFGGGGGGGGEKGKNANKIGKKNFNFYVGNFF
jgi:hypothetical protein